MTFEEKKAFIKAVCSYMNSEENQRYLESEKFLSDCAAFELRLERECFTVAEAAEMFNMPVDAFRYFYSHYLASEVSRLRLTDAEPPSRAVN